MPTVLRLDGLRVVIYPNDHPPPHVHIVGPDVRAIFYLNCPEGPPSIRQNIGLQRSEAKRVADALTDELARLCGEWSVIHGYP